MLLVALRRVCFLNSQLGKRNEQFFNRVTSHKKKFNLHEKTMHIKQNQIDKWTASQSKRQISDKIVRQSKYDFDIKEYIRKFNDENKGKINLMDFSNYTTKFNSFKENPISKKDMEIIKEFQKRKIDQRIHKYRSEAYGKQKENVGKLENPLEYYKDVEKQFEPEDDEIEMFFENDYNSHQIGKKGNKFFEIDDDFIMLILERNTSTKVTTLNRINFYRTVLYMANGNGLISYGKSRALTPEESLTKAIIECKKNIIALPMDPVCTLPRHITSRFQDFRIYLRPLPGFNSWGHPMFSLMFSLSGIAHAGFKAFNTNENNYTMIHAFFKAVTQNTTPQDMAQLEGFKLYRHRFIRPLTTEQTHTTLSR